MVESNAVLVSRKLVMSYVFACTTLIREGVNEVNVKARDRAISRAVDVAKIVRRKFQMKLRLRRLKSAQIELLMSKQTLQLMSAQLR